MTPLTIDAFIDIACPWCFIGTRRLDQALVSVEDVVRATVKHRPFLLVPSVPPEGIEVLTMLRERYGAFEPARFFAPAEAAARESGIPLDLMKQPRTYPTTAALALLRHADARGTGRALAAAFYSAYFLEALNIGDAKVLVQIAAAHGIPPEEAGHVVADDGELSITRREADEAIAMGIRGVPYFVFGGRLALSGAQPLDVYKKALSQAVAADHPVNGRVDR